MAKIIFDANTIKIMSMFESKTRAKLKDCIMSEGSITFIVQEKEIARAVGPKGANVKSLERALKKRVRVVEYSPDVIKFIRNLTYPANIAEADQADKIITLRAADSKSRGMLIGREANILRAFEAVVKRYFDIEEIKVI